MQGIITLKYFTYFHISEQLLMPVKRNYWYTNHCSIKNTFRIGLFKNILIHSQKRHSKVDTTIGCCIFLTLYYVYIIPRGSLRILFSMTIIFILKSQNWQGEIPIIFKVRLLFIVNRNVNINFFQDITRGAFKYEKKKVYCHGSEFLSQRWAWDSLWYQSYNS